jgi:YHS domain-containing protein
MRSLVWSAVPAAVLSVGLWSAAPAAWARAGAAAGKSDAPAKKDDAREKKPVNKKCPVEPEHEVDPTVTVTYKGKVVGFCCEDCVKTFKANPEKYMKKLK